MSPAIPDTDLLPWLVRDPKLTRLIEKLRGDHEQWHFMTSEYDLNTKGERIADCIFEGANQQKPRDQVVVKLSTTDTEIEFYRAINSTRNADAINYIAEWRAMIDTPFKTPPFNALAPCNAIVLERGTWTIKEKFSKPQHSKSSHSTDRNNCVFHIVRAVDYVHSQHFIHGNLTLDNVMTFRDGSYKLIDFAHVARFNMNMPVHCSPEYCPPEMAERIVANDQGLPSLTASPSYDMWSLGVLILKLYSTNMCLQEFVNLTDEAIVRKIADPSFTFETSINSSQLRSPQRDIVRRLLDRNPSTRGSLRDLECFVPNMLTANFARGEDIARLSDKMDALHVTMAQRERYCLPCLWTLEQKDHTGFLPSSLDKLIKTEYRIAFVCEMRGPDCPCELYQTGHDDDLIVTANSTLVQGALPFLKFTSTLLKVLGCVAGAAGFVTNNVLDFDDATMTNITSAVDAVTKLNEKVEGLELEKKLSDLADEFEKHEEPTEVEEAALKEGTLKIYQAYRNDPKMYETLMRLLVSIKYDWTKHHIVGGLVKCVIKSGFDGAGEVRWVCKAHAESNVDMLF